MPDASTHSLSRNATTACLWPIFCCRGGRQAGPSTAYALPYEISPTSYSTGDEYRVFNTGGSRWMHRQRALLGLPRVRRALAEGAISVAHVAADSRVFESAA